MELEFPKTKFFLQRLKKLNIDPLAKILIIVTVKNSDTQRATNNLQNIELISINQLNVISIIKAKYILIDNKAIDIINQLSNE